MKRLGIEIENPADYTRFVVEGGQRYQAGNFTIPADWSAAAFPMVAAAMTDSDVVLTGLDFSDSQGDKRVVEILRTFGACVQKQGDDRLRIVGGQRLQGGFSIDLSDIPDSLPALSVLATQAEGRTVFTNLEHVRQKETDRVAQMTAKLNSLGCSLHLERDCLVVEGPTPIQGGTVSSAFDHRIAIALVAAGLASEGEVVVTDAHVPMFHFRAFQSLLLAVRIFLLWRPRIEYQERNHHRCSQEAGLSIATVSRVINHARNVDPESEKIIRMAMQKLGMSRSEKLKFSLWP